MRIKSLVVGLGVTAMVLASGSAFADLLFSLNHNSLPDSGRIGTWGSLNEMTSWTYDGTQWFNDGASVEVIDGVKWEKNQLRYAYVWDPNRLPTPGDVPHDMVNGVPTGRADGFRFGGMVNDPLVVNGASIVMAVRPDRVPTVVEHGYSWTSCVDLFYSELVLGVNNQTGKVNVRRKGSVDVSEFVVADKQATILSLVVQNDGSYKVWANGTEIMNVAANNDFATLNPGTADFMKYINVGRNNPDGWTTFNGNIGDTYVYTNALSDVDRMALESSIASGLTAVPEPGSMLAMFSGLIGLAGYAVRRRK